MRFLPIQGYKFPQEQKEKQKKAVEEHIKDKFGSIKKYKKRMKVLIESVGYEQPK